MGPDYQKESRKKHDIDLFAEWLQKEIKLELGVFLVAEHISTGRPIGLIAGVLVDTPSDRTLALQQAVWYVDNLWRGTPVARELDEALAEWGRAQGAKYMMSSHPAHLDLGRFMRQLGYRPDYTSYVKELQHG